MQSWKVCSIFFLFLLVVSLACGGGCKKKKNVFIPMEGNDAPVVLAIPDQSADYGVSFNLDLTPYVTDDHDPIGDLTFAVTSSLGTFTGATFTGTFTTPGDVMIPFRVTDTDDAATSAVFKITVALIPNVAPTVDAIPAQEALVGREFQLDVAAVGNVADDRDAVGDLIFRVTGGGGSFTGGVYTNTFATPGLTAVDFEIEDLDGLITSDSFNVDVYEALVADFTADKTVGFGSLIGVNFTDTSTGNPTGWAWDLDGDGTIDSYLETPAPFDYPAPGWYTVSLTVGRFGTSDTETKVGYIQVSGAGAGSTWYVDDATGSDADDGLSWDNAFLTIQMALNSAAALDVVLVADGLYEGPGNTELDFAGNDIYLMSENGSSVCAIDGTIGSVRAFNFQNGETPDATVRGFTIMYGFAGMYGGGILCNNSNPTIVDCFFYAGVSGQGGGIACLNSNSAIVNCTFLYNWGYSGGGVYCWGSFPTFTGCTFDSNDAERGGGVYGGSASSGLTFTDCLLTYCSVQAEGAGGPGLGGAIHAQGGLVQLRGCDVNNNISYDASGGGIFTFSGATLIIEDCDITDNICPGAGGGIYFDGPALVIDECDISSNTAGGGGGLVCWDTSQATITDSDITGNNAPGGMGGGCYFNNSLPLISSCNISYNNSATGGGMGGGICFSGAAGQLVGCAITNNVSDWGGGIEVYNVSDATLSSCTIANNHSDCGGGGLDFFTSGTSKLRNTIIWANTTDPAIGFGHQLNLRDAGCAVTMNYCDYADNNLDANNVANAGGTFDDTDNNISLDPMFVGSGDFRLLAGSPCIDTGFSFYAILLGLEEDLLGNNRIVDGDGNGIENIDIGAFEYQP
ncbi:MAG: hypothetical protein E3J72_14965 [Planctomycetota bacterium]|nr:MAG: hypothetical protein E3J72_14965 [Planctomycetota bacterium]